MTEREERILNLVIEWSMTHYEVAIALIEAELKREARNLIKERRKQKHRKGRIELSQNEQTTDSN